MKQPFAQMIARQVTSISLAPLLLLMSCNSEPTAPESVESVHINPPALDLMVNEYRQLVAVPKNAEGVSLANRTVTWASNDPSIATVTATGLVTAIALGSTNVVATSEGVSTAVPVSVTAAVGELDITVRKIGLAADPQGLTVLIDGEPLGNPLTTVGSRVVTLPVGMHTASISGVESRCNLLGDPSAVTFVVTRQRVALTFFITCLQPGRLRVVTETTGQRTNNNPYRISIDGGEEMAIDANGEVVLDLRPQTYRVALATEDVRCLVGAGLREIAVREALSDAVLFQVRCFPDPPSLAGEKLVVSHTSSTFGTGLDAMDINGANRFTFGVGPAGAGDAALSADGKRLAFRRFGGTSGSRLVVLDVGTWTESVSANLSRISGLSWSPDGQRLVTGLTNASNLTSLVVLRPDGSLERSLGPGEYTAVSADWSPDGSTIAFTRNDHNIVLVNPDGTNLRAIRSDAGLYFDGPSWSPDGRKLLVRSYRQWCYYYSYCYTYDARVEVVDVATGRADISVQVADYAFGFVWGRTTGEVYFIQAGDVFYSPLPVFSPVNVTRSLEDEWSVLVGRFEGGATAARKRASR
jgi:hypothetical protein